MRLPTHLKFITYIFLTEKHEKKKL